MSRSPSRIPLRLPLYIRTELAVDAKETWGKKEKSYRHYIYEKPSYPYGETLAFVNLTLSETCLVVIVGTSVNCEDDLPRLGIYVNDELISSTQWTSSSDAYGYHIDVLVATPILEAGSYTIELRTRDFFRGNVAASITAVAIK